MEPINDVRCACTRWHRTQALFHRGAVVEEDGMGSRPVVAVPPPPRPRGGSIRPYEGIFHAVPFTDPAPRCRGPSESDGPDPSEMSESCGVRPPRTPEILLSREQANTFQMMVGGIRTQPNQNATADASASPETRCRAACASLPEPNTHRNAKSITRLLSAIRSDGSAVEVQFFQTRRNGNCTRRNDGRCGSE